MYKDFGNAFELFEKFYFNFYNNNYIKIRLIQIIFVQKFMCTYI